MPVLTWRTDAGPQQHELGDVTVIGRVAECDVVLPDQKISRKHACIRHVDGKWMFEDGDSRNGSKINGTVQATAELSAGHTIEIGPFRLIFQAAPPVRPELQTAVGGIVCDDDGVSEHMSAIGSLDLSVGAPAAAADTLALSRRLQASYEIAKATAETLSVPDLLDKVLTAMFGIFDSTDRGMILLVDPVTGALSRGAVRERSGDVQGDIQVSETALNRALEKREAVLCVDTQDDGRFSAAQSIVDIGIRSMMIAPLVFRDQLFGAIYLDALKRTVRFQDEDLQLLSVAAAEVAAAIANAELHRQVVKNERMAAMGETVAGLSHCIKNILQGVKSGSYMVDKGLETENMDRVDRGWQVVKKKNDFMEALVWDLLTLSKPREPAYESASLNDLCAEICEIGSQREDGEAVEVTFNPDTAMPPVELDAKGIRRCLLNLVTNAVDACAESGGEVTVETHFAADGHQAHVSIRDNGCGMSEETLAKLFAVFFSTKGSKGTGLGLPVTKKIVEEHGGILDVASREGEGTTFTVRLPIVHAPDA